MYTSKRKKIYLLLVICLVNKPKIKLEFQHTWHCLLLHTNIQVPLNPKLIDHVYGWIAGVREITYTKGKISILPPALYEKSETGLNTSYNFSK